MYIIRTVKINPHLFGGLNAVSSFQYKTTNRTSQPHTAEADTICNC